MRGESVMRNMMRRGVLAAACLGVIQTMFGQLSPAEGKRDCDTIYVLDVSGSMVSNLTAVIDSKMEKVGFFNRNGKNAKNTVNVRKFLDDPENRDLVEGNRLQRYVKLLEKEIDEYDRGYISLMLFANGPVSFDKQPPGGVVEIYCSGPNDPKKMELKSVLDPYKHGRSPDTGEPYRGVMVESIFGNRGPTYINATCLKAMELFEQRGSLADYKKNTKMQRLLLYTDGQEMELKSTFEEVIKRFKLAQRSMEGGFEYIEEYAGDEPNDPQSIEKGRRLEKEGLGRRLVPERIALEQVYVRLTETPMDEDVAKYNVKFLNIKEGSVPELNIQCTSVPEGLVQFSSGNGRSLTIPYEGKDQVPSFSLRSHARPGDVKATATLSLSVNDPKFVFANDKMALDFVFARPPKVSVIRRFVKEELQPDDTDDVVATYDVVFEQIKEGQDSKLTISCKSDPDNVLRLVGGDGRELVIPYAGKGAKYEFSLKAKALPGVSIATGTLDLAVNDLGAVLEPKQLVSVCKFLKPVEVIVEWLKAGDKVVEAPDVLDLGRGTVKPKELKKQAPDRVDNFRIVVPAEFPMDKAKLNVKLEGTIAEAIQFLPSSGLRSTDFTTRETTSVGWELRPSVKPGKYEGAIILSSNSKWVVFKGYGQTLRVPVRLEMVQSDVKAVFAGLDQAPQVIDFGKVKQHHLASNAVTNRPAGDHFAVDVGGAEFGTGLFSITLEGRGSEGRGSNAFYITNLDQGNATNKVDGVLTKGGKFCVKLDPALMNFVDKAGAGKVKNPTSSEKGVYEATLILKPVGESVFLNGQADACRIDLKVYILEPRE